MKLSSIEIITSLKKHPNADTLEIAQVMGWQSIVKAGIHKEGDKVVFITIDTILPKETWSDFLTSKTTPTAPIRVKMIRLRGECSAGVILSLSKFSFDFSSFEVGTDITEIIGIKKYVKELPACLSGENEGTFPSHLISRTDEINGLSDLELVEYIIKSGPVTITQKCDGSSITVIINEGIITQVCSRNLSKKNMEESVFWKAAKKLKQFDGFTGIIQGELIGPKIQNNPMGIEDYEIVAFQVLKSSGEYMNYQEMKGFCNTELNCNVVPFVSDSSFEGNNVETVLQKLQNIADLQVYANGQPAEGIVVRPQDYRKSASRRPNGFKILNRNYIDS